MTDRKEIGFYKWFDDHGWEIKDFHIPVDFKTLGAISKVGYVAGYDARNAEVEELKDRLTHEVEMIQGAASDEIERLNKELNNPLIQYKADRMLMDKYEELGNAHVKLVAENLKLRELVGV